MDKDYKHLNKKEVFKNKKLTIYEEELELPNKKKTIWITSKGYNAVGVIAITKDNNILLVKQYRPAIKKTILEIPAGIVEEGEDESLSALRELEEETGYRADSVKELFNYFTSPSFSTAKMFIYEAFNLTKTKQNLDEDEFLEVVEMPIEKFLALEGTIKDAKTLFAIMYLKSRGF